MSGNSVESGGLVDKDAIFETSEGVLVLRLAQPASRRADVTLSLWRETPDRTRVERRAAAHGDRQDCLPSAEARTMSDVPPPAKAPRWALWLPLALFVGFVALVLVGLFRPASREVKSALVGKPLPAFALKQAVAERPGLSSIDFVGGKPKVNHPRGMKGVPAASPESDALSKDLKKRGFTFVGSTIMYAFMQATGLVDDHIVGCPAKN